MFHPPAVAAGFQDRIVRGITHDSVERGNRAAVSLPKRNDTNFFSLAVSHG
jgi:hypothetical protein